MVDNPVMTDGKSMDSQCICFICFHCACTSTNLSCNAIALLNCMPHPRICNATCYFCSSKGSCTNLNMFFNIFFPILLQNSFSIYVTKAHTILQSLCMNPSVIEILKVLTFCKVRVQSCLLF